NENEHDRCRAGFPQHCRNPSSARRHDDFRTRRHNIFRKFLQLFHLLGGPTAIDADVARTDPPEGLKPLSKCSETGAAMQIARANQNADVAHSVKLLRARREWPRHSCTAEQRDELAPSHVGHGAVLPPLCANEGHGCTVASPRIQGITERTAGPWATPEMF